MSPAIALSLLVAAMTGTPSHSARILGLFPDLSRSHTTQSRPLFRALAARGHHVTILSGYPDTGHAQSVKQPSPTTTSHASSGSYRDIVIDGLPAFVESAVDFGRVASDGVVEAMFGQLDNPFTRSIELVIESAGTQSLLRSNETFDLIFIDLTYSLFNLGFVHKFGNPPFIGVVPFGSNMIGETFAGTPHVASCVPSIMLPLGNRMGFFERLLNAVEYATSYYLYFNGFLRAQDALMRRYFGQGVPGGWEIARNMSLLMVNTDVAHDYPRALPPNVVEIGGLHLTPALPLPKDIEQFIEESVNGVVYFSLGSMLHTDKLGPAKLQAVLSTFRALPQRVLWKWESETVPDIPDNVMARKWLPQNDVLGHPNVKLFITHGGISSLEEAIYHAVPMVVVPLMGDQFFQAKKMVQHGIGVKVGYKSMTTDTLLDAVNQVLKNTSYRHNIKRINRLSRDKIASPLKTAIFWTEYVLRHGGAQHLSPAGAFMSWHKYFLLDVIVFLLAVFIGVICILLGVGFALQRRFRLHRRTRFKTWLHRLAFKSWLISYDWEGHVVIGTLKVKWNINKEERKSTD